jgi:hypothetical protein
MDIVISETETSTYSYHLRKVVGGRLYLGGGAPAALCGARLAWDTQFPISAWGKKDHIPSKWCRACATLAGLAT